MADKSEQRKLLLAISWSSPRCQGILPSSQGQSWPWRPHYSCRPQRLCRQASEPCQHCLFKMFILKVLVFLLSCNFIIWALGAKSNTKYIQVYTQMIKILLGPIVWPDVTSVDFEHNLVRENKAKYKRMSLGTLNTQNGVFIVVFLKLKVTK